MKILLVSDFHLSYKNIRTRSDESSQAGLNKLEWMYNFCKSNSINTVIQGGDLFHSKDQPVSYLSKVVSLLSKPEWHWNVVIGNHSLTNDNFDTWASSPTGLLVKSGLVSLLGDLNISSSYIIRGYSAYSVLDISKPSDVVGLVCHHWTEQNSDALYLNIPHLKDIFPNLRWVLPNHDHRYKGDVDNYGVKSIHPGSVIRLTSGIENMREPKVCVLDTDINEVIYYSIPSHDFNDLFILEPKVINNIHIEAVDQFDTLVSKAVDNTSSSSDLTYIFESLLESIEYKDDKDFILNDLKMHNLYC